MNILSLVALMAVGAVVCLLVVFLYITVMEFLDSTYMRGDE